MKAKLKKDLKNIRVTWPLWLEVVLLVVATIVYFTTGAATPFIYALCVSGAVIHAIYPYQVTNYDILQGNGVVSISRIARIVREPKSGFSLYYIQIADGKERRRLYYPQDEKQFIDTLLAINPKIELIK